METAIFNLGLQLPTTHKANIVTESSNWAEEGDLTLMLIQDSGVLRLYRDFLNDWTRAFRNATATGPGTCDPNMVKPLIYKSKKALTSKKEFQHKKKPKNSIKKQNGHIKKNIGFNRNRQFLQGIRWEMRRRLGSNKPRSDTWNKTLSCSYKFISALDEGAFCTYWKYLVFGESTFVFNRGIFVLAGGVFNSE